MKRITLLTFLCFVNLVSFSQVPTCVPASISNELILSKIGSPYRICTRTTVEKTGRLVIEPGVELIFDSDLSVRGELLAEGTDEDSLTFTSNGLNTSVSVAGDGVAIINFVKANVKFNNVGGRSIEIDNSKVSDVTLSGIATICRSSLFGCNVYSVGGVERVTNCYLDSTTLYGMKIVYNSLFENCKEGIVSFDTDSVVGNTFRNCESAVVVGANECYIGNNLFENNEIAIDVFTSHFSTLENNFFKNNVLVTSLMNFDKIDFGNNCWSNSFSEEKLLLNDSIISVDEVPFFTSAINFLPIANNCIAGYDEFFISVIDTTEYFSINGLAHTDNNLLSEGTAFLYSSEDIGFEPVAIDDIEKGEINFEKIDSGLYTILVVPNKELDYEGTYFVNKSSIITANTIEVYGDITEIDIRLNEEPFDQAIGNIDYVLELDKQDVADGRYPVLISERTGNEKKQYYWTIGTVENGVPILSLEGLNPSDYEVTIPKNGFSSRKFCLIYDGVDFMFDDFCVISGVEREHVPDSFFISPNPSSNNLHVDVLSQGEYVIINNYGEIVKEGLFDTLSNDLDVSDLSNGMYFISVSSISGIVTESFIKID